MRIVRTSTLLACALAAGCGSLDGVFAPACIAYEGDRIVFDGRRFSWDRFTDARRVDDDGNIVDPFPEYPKTGRYEVDSARVSFYTDDGGSLDDRYLLEHRGDTYLLNWEDNEAVLDGEAMPACALRQQTPP